MKKNIWLFVLFGPFAVFAQSDLQTDRRELQDLLNERKFKFDHYNESLEKRSGIFGNKTKADIKESNEILIEIVKQDNKIISTLNRVVDFRNYEKVTMNYDLRDRNQTLKNLETAVDTLAKEADALKGINKSLSTKLTARNFLLYIFIGTSVAFFLLYVRKKK